MKGHRSKLLIVTVTFLLIAAGCAAPTPPPTATPVPPAATPIPPTATPDPPTPTPAPPTATPLPPAPAVDAVAPVKAWVEAINRGDVDAALALFTDRVRYLFVFDATGKEQLHGVFDWMVGIESKFVIDNCQQTKNDQAVCTFTHSSGCTAAYGATDGLAMKGTYSLAEDGKIRLVMGKTEGAEWDSVSKWTDKVLSWQQANRAEEAAKADYSLGKAGGAVQIKLCKEYAESLKAAPAAAAPVKMGEGQVLLIAQERSLDMQIALYNEVNVMISMLKEAGYQVVVASVSGQPITSRTETLTPDLKLADAQADDYVGLIVPCMSAWSSRDDAPLVPAEAVEIAREAVAEGKPVAAQDVGVAILGTAGALDGKQYAYFSQYGKFAPKGIYKGVGVVQDGNIITSGSCPYVAMNGGPKDTTTELTQKFIDLLARSSSQ